MRLPLTWLSEADGVVTLRGILPPGASSRVLSYATSTGALLRIEGEVAGAFDREHRAFELPPSGRALEIALEVERRSLPESALPSGPGVRWWWLNRRASRAPARSIELEEVAARGPGLPGAQRAAGGLALIGHAHLDVAWLWTYAEAGRKATRTFATAARQLEANDEFVFTQSQPQLYAFVERHDEALFARVARLAREGRFDASGAALWVEADCNLPSGESLLRQMIFGVRFADERLGTQARVAWLPDSFGFANTLPTLLAHAGIPYFATTKLMWNDTTRFPHERFRWQGPDGSEVVAALLASYDGDADPRRVKTARERGEPLVIGVGDGGGGVQDESIVRARGIGEWTRLDRWFDRLAQRRGELPVHRDELYLEYHRATYTTHHDIKAGNFELEARLDEAEELAAWCVAVHASPFFLEELRGTLQAAWRTVLRNQFHDVLPGSAAAAVYDDVRAEYGGALRSIEGAAAAARSALPRQAPRERAIERCEPLGESDGYLFDNGLLRARIRRDGSLSELAANGARNVVTVGNALAAYVDRPAKWDAWNLDRGYAKKPRKVRKLGTHVEHGAVIAEYALGGSQVSLRYRMFAAEPYLRADVTVRWIERHTLLRVENWLAVEAREVTFGSPHGTVRRTAFPRTDAERAKYEAPGQRYARVEGADGTGVALFVTDSYGWSARGLERGGVHLGHSLLRGSCWPDPGADLGEHRFALAYLPYERAGAGALERAWRGFALPSRVRLFSCDDDALAIVACKPADDGEGVILRVRECDGSAREARIRCAGRARDVRSVDALERPVERAVRLHDGTLQATFEAFQIRSFRVRF